MFIGQGIVLPQSSVRVSILSVPAPTVSILGLTDNPTFGPTVQIGNETNYTAQITLGTMDAISWGQEIDDLNDGTSGEFGNGANPTDLTAAAGDSLVLGVRSDGAWYYSRPYTIRQAPPQVDQGVTLPNIIEGQGPVDVSVSNAFAGNGITLSLVNPPTGVSLVGNSIRLDGSQITAQSGIPVTLRATNSGGFEDAPVAFFDVTVSEIIASPPPPATARMFDTQLAGDLEDRATCLNIATYTSPSGTVAPVSEVITRDGLILAPTDEVMTGETIQFEYTVDQNTGPSRTFPPIVATVEYFLNTTNLPGGNLGLDINDNAPGTMVFDTPSVGEAPDNENILVSDARSGPLPVGLDEITFTGDVADLEVGDVLTAEEGDWLTTEAGLTFSYQWTRGGADISGATSSTYTLVAADEGEDIDCEITADDGTNQTTITTAAVSIPGATATIQSIVAAAANPKALWDFEAGNVFNDEAGTTAASIGDVIEVVTNQDGNVVIDAQAAGGGTLQERTFNGQTLRYSRNNDAATEFTRFVGTSRSATSYFAFVGYLDTALTGNNRFAWFGEGSAQFLIGQGQDGNSNSWINGTLTPSQVFLNGIEFTGTTRNEVFDETPKDQPGFFEFFIDLTSSNFDNGICPFYTTAVVQARSQSEVGPGVWLSAEPSAADRQVIKDHFAALAGITIA